MHNIIRLGILGVVHVEEAWIDSGYVGGRRVVIGDVGSAEGGDCMLIVFVDQLFERVWIRRASCTSLSLGEWTTAMSYQKEW